MAKSKHIPTLGIPNLDKFHFGDVPWRFSRQHHLFHINRLDGIHERLNFPLPPHRKTVYDMLFLTKGESVRSKGLNQYTFRQYDFFILPALQVTAHESMSRDAEGFFVHFSPNLFSDKPRLPESFPFFSFHANPIVRVPESQAPPILNIFERLLDIYERHGEAANLLVTSYLMALFAEANQHFEPEKTKAKNSAALLTQRYKEVLTQHIYAHHTVQEFAHMLYVSPNHLNKCVKKTLGQSAQSLLNEMLILEAKSLLKYSDLSIAEIAERLHGSTPSNFSRFFRNQSGITPKEYKEQ